MVFLHIMLPQEYGLLLQEHFFILLTNFFDDYII
jgi:hypothetical protein